MCKKSESIKEIATALAKFNMKVKRIEKDSTNPHFKNKYASLDGIMDDIRPLLAEEGLSVIQMPGGIDGRFAMTTMLVHTSGEWIESPPIEMTPTKYDPQGIGSATTYARRYGVSAFLGLSTGEVDDDGNAASQVTQRQQSAYTPPPAQTQPTTVQTATNGPKPVSEAQIKYIQTTKSKQNVPDDAYRDILSTFGVVSTKDLTSAQASKVIERLTAYIPAPSVTQDDFPF